MPFTIKGDIMEFKDKIIYILVGILIFTNALWFIVHTVSVWAYFYSDYSYINNTNTNVNTLEKGDE